METRETALRGQYGGVAGRDQRAHHRPAVLHLVVVRRDSSGYQYVHSRLDGDGTWRVAVPLDRSATYHAFADFESGAGDLFTLGVEVTVPGAAGYRPLPEPATEADTDGCSITLDGYLVAGEGAQLTFSVHRDGRSVADLQPHLAAFGHLMTLRGGDLSHPYMRRDGEPGDGVPRPGPEITFRAIRPTGGAYRLRLDVRYGDQMRVAEFAAVEPADLDPRRAA
ncbi:hypothetical protein ACFV1W_28185 [Kitasatospora sp. NPDC059648]|uniref:hypothetical protein n=1 Tax=Kitasatospora sp. NPDC059648 TaxID=3346894 RepID=UPI0036856060